MLIFCSLVSFDNLWAYSEFSFGLECSPHGKICNALNNYDTGKFQNLDPKSVTFFHVLRHFLTQKGNLKYHNRNLDNIVVILVVDLVF